jgi:hypothetical protein
MGINGKDLQLLVRLTEQGHIRRGAKVVEIGAQQLSNSFLRSVSLVRTAEALFDARHPFALPDPGPAMLGPGRAELQESGAPFARDFWMSLGFDYAAIDVDGSPGSIPLDLNFDAVPTELRGRYDLVTNLGTTEHICNQMNAFKIIHDLAAPGAVMIHHLPAGGAPNHGLVNYNPKFFWYLARSNDYKWLYMDYHGGEEPYPLPENIFESVKRYEPAAAKMMRGRITTDYAIQVALLKTLDIAFVPPLDVEEDAATTDIALKERYWTVFQPRILDSVRRSGGARALVSQYGENEAMETEKRMVDGGAGSRSAHGYSDISDEIRNALNLKIAGASDEIRFAMARAIADSEESIRAALDRTVSNSEEAVRAALDRTVSSSEEAVRNAVNQVVSQSEEAIRAAIDRTVSNSEEAVRVTLDRTVSNSEEAVRTAMNRIPGRRFVALVGAASAVIAAATVAVILVAARLLLHS